MPKRPPRSGKDRLSAALLPFVVLLMFCIVAAAAGNALVAHIYLAAMLAALAVISSKGE